MGRINKKERADFIVKTLDRLFPKVPVPLIHKDPYTLLIAVLLSGQSTDKAVNKVTPELFAKADTPQKMVRLGVAAIRKIIKPCGLSPAKSKYIHALSKLIIQKHNGKVPRTFEALEALPGVGHKTASVVLMQAFGVPTFPVDTHIHRLAARWGLSNGKSVARTEKDLKKIFPQKLWPRLHLQMIFFGRKFCPARGHNTAACPICSVISRA